MDTLAAAVYYTIRKKNEQLIYTRGWRDPHWVKKKSTQRSCEPQSIKFKRRHRVSEQQGGGEIPAHEEDQVISKDRDSRSLSGGHRRQVVGNGLDPVVCELTCQQKLGGGHTHPKS